MSDDDRPPVLAQTLAGVAVAFLALPIVALAWRAPWQDLWAQVASARVLESLRLSLVCSLAATALSFAVGVPLAWVLATTESWWGRVVRAVSVLPMILPPVVGGVALLAALGRRGVVGQWLDRAFDVQLPFTTTAAVLAETFVAMPFLVLTVEAGFRAADRRLPEAARTLGASRWTVLRRVTLPLVRPSLAAGAVLCWARALGEFGATITFAGSFPGRTRTTPLEVYLLLEADPGAAVALSLVLLAVSLAVLVSLRARWLGGA